MAALARLRVEWSGAGITGPGLSTFYFDPADVGASDVIFDFFNSAPLLFPNSVSIFVPSGGDIIEELDGTLAGTWNDPGTGGTVAGTNSGDFFAGVGMRVKWPTDGIFAGRRVVGSTFLVPIAAAISDTTGTIDSATVTAVQTSADVVASSSVDFKIWSRPSGVLTGESNSIVEAQVPDRTSWLRSRRT